MTFPPDSVMQTLGALAAGVRFEYAEDTGEMRVYYRDGRSGWVVDGDDLDALTARGWVEADTEGVSVTERGAYWLARWRKANKLIANPKV